jgi:hypothetical protein
MKDMVVQSFVKVDIILMMQMIFCTVMELLNGFMESA